MLYWDKRSLVEGFFLIGLDSDFGQRAKIRVIGVGGCGNNSVNRMIDDKVESIDFIAANTDALVLQRSKAAVRIELGKLLTNGLGAGGKPEVGKQSAEEQRNDIAKHLEGADLVFVTAGMGGGTGTGAAPVIAAISQSLGILTVGVVTKPFDFEGRVRMRNALSGIDEMKKNVDALIVIPNQKLYTAMNKNTSMSEAFRKADDVLIQGVTGISDLITKAGEVNRDFADVRTVLTDKGMAHMGIGYAAGDNKAEDAMKAAINSPLLETSIQGARSVLVNFASKKGNITLDDTNIAMNILYDMTDDEAEIFYGTSENDDSEDGISITLIATGFDTEFQPKQHTAAPLGTITSFEQGKRDPSIHNTQPSPYKSPQTVAPNSVEQYSTDPKTLNGDSNQIDLPSFLLGRKKNKPDYRD